MKKNKRKIYTAVRLHDNGLLQFRPAYQAWTQTEGANSSILIHHHEAENLLKVVSRFGHKKGGFTFDEAVMVLDDVFAYRQELEELGVPMPVIEDMYVEYHSRDKRAEIARISEWTGNDVSKILRHIVMPKHREYLEAIALDMCNILSLVCHDRLKGYETRLGIDPKCNNFTLDRKGDMRFVDIFPPRLRKNRIPLVEWPQPQSDLGRDLGYFKHYDVRGIMLGLLAQASRIRPDLRAVLESLILENFRSIFSEKEFKEVVKEYVTLPWLNFRELIKDENVRLLNLDAIEEIIRRAPETLVYGVNYHAYALRELAVECGYAGLMSQKELNEFFNKSHFENALSKKLIAELQEILRRAVRIIS